MARMPLHEYLESLDREKLFVHGVRVEATRAAHERYYGLVGYVIHLRETTPWKQGIDHAAALVNWYDSSLPSSEHPRYSAHKHKLCELKLYNEEQWDEDAAYPVPPELPPEQTRVGRTIKTEVF